MRKLSKENFNKLVKNKNKKELKELIIKAVNEDLKEGLVTDNQLLELIKLKNQD